MSGLTMDILRTFRGVFMFQCVKLMLKFFFWIWGFNVWFFSLSPKCNLCERFYQVWHYAGEVEDRQTCSCLLHCCAKNRTFSCGLIKLRYKAVGFVFLWTNRTVCNNNNTQWLFHYAASWSNKVITIAIMNINRPLILVPFPKNSPVFLNSLLAFFSLSLLWPSRYE